ncbi:ATP-binding protein [Alkalimonas collagenimarina]|uniref:histidine kinase n=1 Tax=Alkalimonas collagenimarina TaxID=400390 RepID=A0ABT9GY93_9GAMM|nr:HAMP domain-containing sensor histidine kinase [Alkalimonas collagenimarina]MDP4536031.1 ATP-binding protein [Alkalimonas collagenimarina]
MTKLSNIRRWHQASLQRSLLFYVVLPMLLLTGLAIRFGLTFTNELVISNLRSDLELIGRAIRVPISDALLKQDTATIHAHLESVFTIGRVYGASIYDTDGALVAATGVIERDLSDSQLASEVVRTGQQQDGYRSVSGQSLFSHFLPIIDRSGQIHGLLQISRKGSDFEQSLDRLSTLAWLSWLALALLSLLIMWRGHKRVIGEPINELVSSMRQVASGDSNYRAKVQGPVELQEVARGLNQMLDEIKRAEQQLLQQQKQQRHIEQQLKEKETMAAIGQVVSGVAHELGAPLSVIDGRAQRLLRQQPDEDGQRQLQAIRGQVLRLNHMVKQLQAFAHTPVASWQQIALPQLLQQAIQGISYELQQDEAMPEILPPCPAINIQVDVPRLELALVNVLRNAIQAATQRVVIVAEVQQNRLHIRVQDDGEGLANNLTTAQMMSPFVSTKPQGKGTGLGLAIVQQIMQEHHGSITLHNRNEGGCEVTLTLPINLMETH